MNIDKLIEDLKFDADVFSDLNDSDLENTAIRCIGAIQWLQDQLKAANNQEPIGYTSENAIYVCEQGLGLGSYVKEKREEYPIPIYVKPRL